jgi:hypothetical protein
MVVAGRAGHAFTAPVPRLDGRTRTRPGFRSRQSTPVGSGRRAARQCWDNALAETGFASVRPADRQLYACPRHLRVSHHRFMSSRHQHGRVPRGLKSPTLNVSHPAYHSIEVNAGCGK